MSVQPFTIHIDDEVLDDLKQRLQRTRWPDEISASGWDYGTNLNYLKQLVTYWRETYDWRAQERLLNRLPQFQTTINGLGLHFVHVKGKGPNPTPLLLLHGWPGSFFEMYKIIGPLSDPVSFGGSEEDAFDVVVPSLPGYGFSERSHERGMNPTRMADIFLHLMRDELGYEHFTAHGGDWGSVITHCLAYTYPQHLIGIHLTMDSSTLGITPQEIASLGNSPEIEKWQAQIQHHMQDESAYASIQGTRPQTLAYGLNDSPVALAGWIIEKFRAWSDCQGELERVFSKDELLTNIMIYWVTETINSSIRLYYETFHTPQGLASGSVDVPTAMAAFPHEIIVPVRKIAERAFNIQHWSTMQSGGHFAALEQPEVLVNDIRAFIRSLRK